MAAIIGTGFLFDPTVQTALIVGGVAAALSGLAGFFVVGRGESFGGHALADISAAGGAGAGVVGISPLAGFVAMNAAAAAVMSTAGSRPRARDIGAGIVLGAALGLAALFLYLDTTVTSSSNTAQSVLFGSIFTIAPTTGQIAVAAGLADAAVLLWLTRPLLLVTVSPDLAAARGLPVRRISLAFLLTLAFAVSLSSLTVGAILSTALLIAPAAAARSLTSRPGRAAALATTIAVSCTWLGVMLAYDSFYWFPDHRALPASFLVVVLAIASYLAARVAPRAHRASRSGMHA